MPFDKTTARRSSWLPISARILLVTFLLTLLSFAVTLLFAIFATILTAYVRGVHPSLVQAYRLIAMPVAAVVGAIVFISTIVFEIRRYRQSKVLAAIERNSAS